MPTEVALRPTDDAFVSDGAARATVGQLRPATKEWFAREAPALARALVGALLVHEVPGSFRFVARIVETEAYCGPRDLACHARAGLTKRTRSLFGPEGHAYVFFVYGMHDCFNVTCRGAGSGHAVLVRAAEAVSGFAPGARLDGPGRLARAMSISRAHDGYDLTRPPLYVCPRTKRPARIDVTPRVGVAYAGSWADRHWRYLDASSASVSKPPKSTIGRCPRPAGDDGPSPARSGRRGSS
ncbi:MAG: DNA-3-methyladenine glycosylase [Polyangiaceae bacterium]|nr:DNA-3-methyladenine glycosylase [Polyangiaceae bacterium]